MKQVLQPANSSAIEVLDVPRPTIAPTQVLVATEATVISAGTERAVTKLAQSSLLAKARARPDLVRQVLSKAKTDGVMATANAVRTRLDDDIELGYSGAGVIVEVGDMVRGLRPGQRVATAGGGFATHAEFQAVPAILVSPIPDEVPSELAAFATVASVGLHGLRLADLGVGSNVVVVGLGLIGQLTSRLAMAAGHRVLGIDLQEEAVELAKQHGVTGLLERGEETTRAILDWSRGRGADAIIITAGSRANSDVIAKTPARCRDRATVVAVGDVGLDLDRNAFYEKELELRVSRSYGPGRYDPSYEEWGVDYPIGHVRWTQQRNLETYLTLLADGRLSVQDLISHRFPIGQAQAAYATLEEPKTIFGVVLDYPGGGKTIPSRTNNAAGSTPGPTAQVGLGIIGAGIFVRATMLPALKEAGYDDPAHVASARGASAARLADRFEHCATSSGHQDLLDDPRVNTVAIASPHKNHGALVLDFMNAGKNVYVEKPLAISESELDDIEIALAAEGAPNLYVGFNRRWSDMIGLATQATAGGGPRHLVYRVNAGPLPQGHWYADRTHGGRLLGEVCHFIDTCAAVVGASAVSVSATSTNDDAHDSHSLLIDYADGSSALIAYIADAHPRIAKESLEIHGNGHSALVDNYRTLLIDGSKQSAKAGKGHAEGLEAFRHAIVAGERLDPSSALETTRVAFAALRSASTGERVWLRTGGSS